MPAPDQRGSSMWTAGGRGVMDGGGFGADRPLPPPTFTSYSPSSPFGRAPGVWASFESRMQKVRIRALAHQSHPCLGSSSPFARLLPSSTPNGTPETPRACRCSPASRRLGLVEQQTFTTLVSMWARSPKRSSSMARTWPGPGRAGFLPKCRAPTVDSVHPGGMRDLVFLYTVGTTHHGDMRTPIKIDMPRAMCVLPH